ncbi:MAG: holo-ACP synthase [Thermodesulfobacteriota bacterium]
MIRGVGIDIIDVVRFKAAMKRFEGRLEKRLFTEAELSYCAGLRHSERHLATRFAAKVSVFKALGRTLPYKDVEVARDSNGRPVLNVKGVEKGFRFSLSLSHEKGFGLAETIVEIFE